MVFKTITIKGKVYEKLVKTKPKEESFSDFLSRLVEVRPKKVDIMKFAGAWSNLSDEEFEKIKKSIKELRESANKSFAERMKRFYG